MDKPKLIKFNAKLKRKAYVGLIKMLLVQILKDAKMFQG